MPTEKSSAHHATLLARMTMAVGLRLALAAATHHPRSILGSGLLYLLGHLLFHFGLFGLLDDRVNCVCGLSSTTGSS